VAFAAADARLADVAQMPGDSPWPILLALCLSLVFVAVLAGTYTAAAFFLGLCALALLGWHSREPEET
jgi:ABC-type molybdate transport system permease subunit